MSEPKVVFDKVWKKFRRGERHDSLRDLVPSAFRAVVGKSRSVELGAQEFWALRDVSFSVQSGQALGIIGANGAGKSTALKLLTRVLRPTQGRARLSGKVGALIEVAAGFHGDLTGRENIFLQGAIMGMPKAEIVRKMSEIIEFSGIEPFIDTQVKRYSSGMNARLGFSIAAHLDPDVLIIDEVLAVGDMQFQRKAFDKIASAARNGAAVVVVSHQLDRVAELCDMAVLLENGSVLTHDSPEVCIQRYLSRSVGAGGLQGSDALVFETIAVSQLEIGPGESLRVTIAGVTGESWSDSRYHFGIRILAAETGSTAFSTGSDRLGINIGQRSRFEMALILRMNSNGGAYVLEGFVWDGWQNQEVVKGPTVALQVRRSSCALGYLFLEPVVANVSQCVVGEQVANE